MATIDDLLQRLPSFWDLLPAEDRVALRTLWSGYAASTQDQWIRLFQIDLAKSIRTITPTVRREWWYLPLNASTVDDGILTFRIDHELVSAPELTQGVTIAGVTLVDQSDYTIDHRGHTIAFTSALAKTTVGPKFTLTDPLGQRTAVGLFVDGGGLTGLVSGTDYLLTSSELQLYSRDAFDTLGEAAIPEATQILSTGALFAPVVFTDEDLVYRNFGSLLGISPDDVPVSLETYTQVVKGLWYIAWNGPTPRNLRNGVNLLFGYPVAPVAGQILKVAGQDVTLTGDKGSTQVTITVPSPFVPIVTPGQTVQEFDALSDAVTVVDELNTPEWWINSIGLTKYLAPGATQPTPFRAIQLKEQLKNHVFSIRLKAFNSFTDMDQQSQIINAGSRFLTALKPLHTQFSFQGDILFPEGDEADSFDMVDTLFAMTVGRRAHPTVEDNPVNDLRDVGFHPVTPFADFDAYYASADGGFAAGNRAYCLDSDDPRCTDSLLMEAQWPGSGGYHNTDGSDGVYNAWADPLLADVLAPNFLLTPPAGEYAEELFVRVRPSEVCRTLYTIDGTDPDFTLPEVGSQVRDSILVKEGVFTIKIIGKDAADNISPVFTHVYHINRTMAPTEAKPSPQPGLKERGPVQVAFSTFDPSLQIYYSLDGRAPTDFVFQDISRLNGHRIRMAAASAIELEDPTKPVIFARGAASINQDGPRTYEIDTQPNRRYFVYLLWTGDKTWRLSFTRDNLRFQPNTGIRLCLGYVITDNFGLITEGGIINAQDAGGVRTVIRDPGLPVGRQILPLFINALNPLAVAADVEHKSLRFFGKTDSGLFDPPQRMDYSFDTVSPTTTIIAAETNSPFTRTLKLELTASEDALIYWSTGDTVPVPVRFGFPQKLNGLELAPTGTPNQVEPSATSVSISFRRRLQSGEYATINTTVDARAGAFLTIPVVPLAFFDVSVVPDVENAGKWRLEVGEANVPVIEGIARYLVGRVSTDVAGVLDTTLDKGFIENAVDSTNTSAAAQTFKYVEPVLLDATTEPYTIKFHWFSVDLAGNVEVMQSQTFTSDE